MWKWIVILCVVCTTTLSAEVKVLAFSGSTREDSFNKKLILEAATIARQLDAKVTVINLNDYAMPFYDGDFEIKEGMPVKAKQFRQLMIESDVVIIASPEYNGSLSAILKNTIDWASRNETSAGSREAFKGKRFVLLSASPGSGGGARGLAHLRTVLENVGGTVLPQVVTVPDAYNAFDDQGLLKSPVLRKELQELVQAAIN